MTIKKIFTGMPAVLLGFMLSCDNTTADPLNNSLNNPNAPGSGSGGSAPAITGPRILHKIVVNNVTHQEYVTTGNVLEKAIFKEDSGPNSFMVARATYTSGKITKVKYQQEVNGVPPANGISQEYNITYDTNGRINYTTCYNMIGSTPSFSSEFTYTYDGSGKMTKIVEKKKANNVYTHFCNYNISNTGDNITKVVSESGITSDAGVPDMSTVIVSTYNFSTYDDKINPYTTLPKTFMITFGLYHPAYFSFLSANNLKTFSIVYPSPLPSIPGTYTYLYDTQNYPVSDQSQAQKYIYKAL